MNVEGAKVRPVEELGGSLELSDRWILSRLNAAAAETTRNLVAYRFHDAAATMYRFLWGELADWYLELVKPRLYGEATEASKATALATLVAVLDGVLRLLHPIMPFISEALWLRLPVPAGRGREESLVVARWPEPRPEWDDADAEAQMTALMELIGEVRTLRSEYRVEAGAQVDIRLANVPAALDRALAAEDRALRRLARIGGVARDGEPDGRAGAHAVLRSGAELFLPLEGIIDLERERERLSDEIGRLEKQLRSTAGRLANEQFVSKAPAEVVEREREKARSFRDQLERLTQMLNALT